MITQSSGACDSRAGPGIERPSRCGRIQESVATVRPLRPSWLWHSNMAHADLEIANCLSINDGARDHSTVQRNPANTRQVDVLVTLLYPEPKPEKRRQEICTPRQHRNPRRLLTDPYRQNLRNRHAQDDN